MKLVPILACLIVESPLPPVDLAKPEIRFSGVCEDAEYELDEGTITFSKLGLNLLEEEGRLASAECMITSSLPAKDGYRISVSEFKAEADALILDETIGFASLFVNHRFNGEDLDGLSSISREDGKLLAEQGTGMEGLCGQEAVLRSKLAIKGKAVDIKVGGDEAENPSLRYSYVPCGDDADDGEEDETTPIEPETDATPVEAEPEATPVEAETAEPAE